MTKKADPEIVSKGVAYVDREDKDLIVYPIVVDMRSVIYCPEGSSKVVETNHADFLKQFTVKDK